MEKMELLGFFSGELEVPNGSDGSTLRTSTNGESSITIRFFPKDISIH